MSETERAIIRKENSAFETWRTCIAFRNDAKAEQVRDFWQAQADAVWEVIRQLEQARAQERASSLRSLAK